MSRDVFVYRNIYMSRDVVVYRVKNLSLAFSILSKIEIIPQRALFRPFPADSNRIGLPRLTYIPPISEQLLFREKRKRPLFF